MVQFKLTFGSKVVSVALAADVVLGVMREYLVRKAIPIRLWMITQFEINEIV
jgi:hypothetical protein